MSKKKKEKKKEEWLRKRAIEYTSIGGAMIIRSTGELIDIE